MFKFLYKTEDGSSEVFVKEAELEKALAKFRENYDNVIHMIILEKNIEIIN